MVFNQVRHIGFQVLGLREPARLFMAWAVVLRRGAIRPPLGGTLWGERIARGA